jgi:sulfur carrier protein
MDVVVNGEARSVPEGPAGGGATIRELLDHLGLTEGPVAVEVNREIVPRAEHVSRRLANGDVIEVVHLVGGG